MKPRLIFVIVTLLVVGCVIYFVIKNFEPDSSHLEKPFTQDKVKGQIRDNGFSPPVNYRQRINSALSSGITLENNAARDIWRLMPPDRRVDGDYLTRVGAALRVSREEMLPSFHGITGRVRARYDLQIGAKTTRESLDDRMQYEEDCLMSPWKSTDFPVWAQCLELNRESIDHFVSATNKPYFFEPIFSTNPQFIFDFSEMPVRHFARQTAFDLAYRAMNHLGEERIDQAIIDIKALRRLMVLTSQSNKVEEKLVPISIFNMLASCEQHLVADSRITRAEMVDYIQFAREHSYPLDISRRIDAGLRPVVLDMIQTTCMESAAKAFAGAGDSIEDTLTDVFAITQWDQKRLDQASELANHSIDRLVAAFQEPTLSKQLARAEAVVAENNSTFDQFLAQCKHFYENPFPPPSDAQFTLWLAQSPQWTLADLSTTQMIDAEFKARVRDEVTQLGFQIKLYFLDHGDYPDNLEALIPSYISEYSQGGWNDIPFVYQRTATGFLLYHFGPDGIDDGGRDYDDVAKGSTEDFRFFIGDPPAYLPNSYNANIEMIRQQYGFD